MDLYYFFHIFEAIFYLIMVALIASGMFMVYRSLDLVAGRLLVLIQIARHSEAGKQWDAAGKTRRKNNLPPLPPPPKMPGIKKALYRCRHLFILAIMIPCLWLLTGCATTVRGNCIDASMAAAMALKRQGYEVAFIHGKSPDYTVKIGSSKGRKHIVKVRRGHHIQCVARRPGETEWKAVKYPQFDMKIGDGQQDKWFNPDKILSLETVLRTWYKFGEGGDGS